ncbi:MAG: response regulator transcription factor [Pseudomonadales bacterium]|nr:response regulator transcription factor [Pseudomonadales bacterium]
MGKLAQILLVEDDQDLAELTADYLSGFGFCVNIESDGAKAVERALLEKPSLLILDVMLPGKDGIDICREVREKSSLPILMLTARGEQIDQILGLEMGADDYVCKPVEPRLLLARVKALLRRAPVEKDNQQGEEKITKQFYQFDNIELDNSARRVKVDDVEVDLTMPEYELLWLLATHAGHILSRAMIFKSIRGIEYDGSNRFVDLTVSHIRMKIGDDGDKPTRIKTVRGKGYLFVPSC